MKKRITVIDLNNFAHYPTLSVGYLIAILRNGGHQVSLFSPLMLGIKSREREFMEQKIDYFKKRFFLSENPVLQFIYNKLRAIPTVKDFYDNKHKVVRTITRNIDLGTELVLISSYLHNYAICKRLGKFFKRKNIPVIIGGPGFNDTKVAARWNALEGVDALVGSEVDGFLNNLVEDFLSGKDVAKYPGVITKASPKMETSFIYRDLDKMLTPDFTDFPWEKYPVRIIPFMTGRGCEWGRCTFCNDVHYVSGRTYRSLEKDKVLSDLEHLVETHRSNAVVFLDLKMNSNLKVWLHLIDNLPKLKRRIKWICTVHLDGRTHNGLDRETLFKAKASGLVRISFGFESASQKLLNHVKKGTTVERVKDFVKDVYDAGISLRATMFVGYPYEDVEDLRLTYEFLQEYGRYFDRISIGYFQLYEMAPIHKIIQDAQKVKNTTSKILVNRGKKYYSFKEKIILQCHLINSKPLIEAASEFDGVM